MRLMCYNLQLLFTVALASLRFWLIVTPAKDKICEVLATGTDWHHSQLLWLHRSLVVAAALAKVGFLWMHQKPSQSWNPQNLTTPQYFRLLKKQELPNFKFRGIEFFFVESISDIFCFRGFEVSFPKRTRVAKRVDEATKDPVFGAGAQNKKVQQFFSMFKIKET